jgi:hypothetical protein
LAGCSISTVRLIEKGWSPSDEMLARIYAALNDETPAATPGSATTPARQGRHEPA